jgi:hypothetical protein
LDPLESPQVIATQGFDAVGMILPLLYRFLILHLGL